MTRHIWSVFSYEFRRNIRRKGFLFSAFGIPVIAFLIFGAVQVIATRENEAAAKRFVEEEQNDKNVLGYVDLSGQFTEPGRLVPFDTETAAQAAMETDEIDGYYVIAADYFETGDILLVVPRFSIESVDESALREMLFNNFTAEVDASIANRLKSPAIVETIRFQRAVTPDAQQDQEGTVTNEMDDFWLVYAFAMVFMLSLFGTNGILMQTVIEEKETRVVEILVSSIRPFELLAGKIFALGSLGILQVVVWIGTVVTLGRIAGSMDNLASGMNFLAQVDVSLDMLAIAFVYFVLGYLFFAAVFGAVGAISVSMTEGPNYATVFTLPLVIPFVIITVFTETPNSTLPVILSIFPLTSPLSMIMRITITNVPFLEIVLSVILLAVTDLAMIWFAARLFRAHTLLAGQLPKIRDIPALLRG